MSQFKHISIFTALLCIFFTSTIVAAIEKDELFDSVIEKCSLGEDEKVIVIFQSLTSCPKCYHNIHYIIESSKKESTSDFKILAFVNCHREKELKVFKKKYNCDYFLAVGGIETKEILGIARNTELAIFNYHGELLLDLNDEDIKKRISATTKIVNVLN